MRPTLAASPSPPRSSVPRWSRAGPEGRHGQVLQAGQGQIPSRQAQIKGGIPKEVPSETVNKVCASGIRWACSTTGRSRRRPRQRRGRRDGEHVQRALPAAQRALRVPDGRRQGDRRDDQRRPHEPVLGQAHDAGGQRGRLRAGADPARHGQLGAAQPRAGDQGHRRGAPAGGDRPGDGRVARRADTVVEVDEAPRRDTSLEALAKLPPMYVKDGSHTAGNAPGVNDGAGALVLASDEWARKEGRSALAKIVASAEVADDFRISGSHARQGRQAGAREGRPEGGRRSTCGRSTRPSRRWPSTPCGCSASTTTG